MWGYQGPANPTADVTLERAVATINAVDARPDFVVFTGDLTHTTDAAAERRERMKRFRDIVAKLKVTDVRFLPGEHDAAPDRGQAYREAFGEPTYAFDHKGVHFVALDNASMPGGALGDAQLAWLRSDSARARGRAAGGPRAPAALPALPRLGVGDAGRSARHRRPRRARAGRQRIRDAVAGTALTADASLAQELQELRHASSTEWMAYPQRATGRRRLVLLLAVWVLLVVMLLAIWQLLSPDAR